MRRTCHHEVHADRDFPSWSDDTAAPEPRMCGYTEAVLSYPDGSEKSLAARMLTESVTLVPPST